MAANWKKILFEGSDIDVRRITASHLTELTSDSPGVTGLPVLSYDTNTGKFRQIAQNTLDQAIGNTIFTISGSDHTTDSFNASSHTLTITTSNPNYLGAALTSTSDTTTITFTPISDYITNANQLNIISGSESDFNNDELGGDWDTAIKPISSGIHNNTVNIASNNQIVDPSNAYTSWNNGDGLAGWRATANLWANSSTDSGVTQVPNPALLTTAGTNTGIYGRRSVYWLSASLLGGFNNGTPSTSASYSDFTGSIFSISASVSNLGISASNLNDFTGSDNGGALLSANTESIVTSFSSKQVFSIEENGNVNQITFFDTDEGGNTLNQGKRIALGTLTTDPDILSVDPDARDLTIGDNLPAGGILTVDSYALGFGLELQQINIQRINGGINFGTTASLHSHSFHGNTFVTGGVNVTDGDFHIGGDQHLPGLVPHDPPHENSEATFASDPIQVFVADTTTGQLGWAYISGSGTLAAQVSGSALTDVGLIETDIATLTSTIGDATGESSDIDDLEDGFTNNSDSLQNLYAKGIYFGTASAADTVVGHKIPPGPLGTASFSGDETEGTNILTTTFASNKVRYTIHPTRFANAALQDDAGRIYTSSVAISQSVVSLNRYVDATDGVLTGSLADSSDDLGSAYTAGDLLYIQDLAADLPGAPAGTQFITGAGSFNDLTNFTGVDGHSSTVQGTIELTFNGVKRAAGTGSGMHTTDSPKFNNLQVDGNLIVEGTLSRINKSNLNVKDQFILINSGAKQAFSENIDQNDKDGGIIVGAGDTSGSLLMYDFSQRAWGFVGALEADNISNEVESSELNTVTPSSLVRVIRYAAGAPPTDINTILYGTSGGNSKVGIMYCDTTPGSEDVYIYA